MGHTVVVSEEFAQVDLGADEVTILVRELADKGVAIVVDFEILSVHVEGHCEYVGVEVVEGSTESNK